MSKEVWKTKDGRELLISKMSTAHIQKTIYMLENKGVTQYSKYQILKAELEKRDDLQIFTWTYGAINCGLSMVTKKEENRPFYRE